MPWKHTRWDVVVQVSLLAVLFFRPVTGSPLRWRNIDINSTTSVDDPVWKELILWSNATLGENPLLNTFARNRSTVRILSDEEMENKILNQLELLKVNYSHVVHELDVEMKDGLESGRYLPRTVDKTLRLINLEQVVSEVETSVMSAISCTACRAGVGLLLHYIRSGKTTDDIIKMSYHFCVSLKIQTRRVCDGITQLFGGEVVYVLKRVTIGAEEICSFIIGDACGNVYNPTHDWDVIFPPVPKPATIPQKLPTEAGSASFKVLQLSDTHFDPYYEEGTNAECNEPLCCRLTNGRAKSAADGAGRWGDYRKCDTPKRTIDHMFQHIISTHPDIDYILWTGDLPPHDVWNQTLEDNLSILKQTVIQMNTLFPGIPIFPALGNHESSPVNSFPPPFVQTDYAINWLYDELDKHWRQWLPSSVSGTIRRGAFYSVLVRPGFRIISLNMNYCNNKNWWLLLNSTDPAQELQWFIYELQSAEFNKEKVHIIGHIPPGHADCLKVWSRNYYLIIARYESTITAQFFGHTHFDEFQLFYDPNDLGRAVSISYVSPSVTPFINLNPGYRIYYVDGDRDHSSRTVLDHETWVMNLKEANLYGYPIWYKLYSVRDSYSLSNLLPQEWDNLTFKMAENEQLFDQYYKNYWKNSPVRPACDLKCRKRMICDLRCGRSHNKKAFCHEIESKIDANQPKDWKAWLYDGVALSVEATTVNSGRESDTEDETIALHSLFSFDESNAEESTSDDTKVTVELKSNDIADVEITNSSLESNSRSASLQSCVVRTVIGLFSIYCRFIFSWST